ncbi:MAG TPA: sigma-70 family RNA polymerase sigma factor [Acidimicrobiia bacterium]
MRLRFRRQVHAGRLFLEIPRRGRRRTLERARRRRPGRDDLTADDIRETSDAQLVVAIGRFHEQALAEAYRRHAGGAFGLALRITGDRTLAEEVVQEVFLRLWNEPERFDPARGSLRSFLLANTHGRAVDLVRAETARRTREERDARRSPGAGYDLEREVWDLTLAAHVRDALERLTDDERAAIELAYFGGHTYREVASLLDAPEGTVKSRIRTGLGRLREALVGSGALGTGGPWLES